MEFVTHLTGSGWGKNEKLEIHIYGPQNTVGVTPTDRLIGYAFTTSAGSIWYSVEFDLNYSRQAYIPFDQALPIGNRDYRNVPRPGLYTLAVERPNPITVFDEATNQICIAPDTNSASSVSYLPEPWFQERGARDGGLGDHSPERADPEWLSVWSETPVGVYGTIASTSNLATIDDPPCNQPSFIAHADLPFTHFGHDVNMELLPDPQYMWTIGTGNYTAETQIDTVGTKKANYGRMECEWETLNNGKSYYGSYGKGSIGMPLFVMPTAGDRVYMAGRWVLDNGHPDSGERTEIHPPCLLATMRKRNSAAPFNNLGAMTRASQVDVYVSGHGGGANKFPDGLFEALDSDGPGGVIWNVLDQKQLDTYFAWGPGTGALVDILNSLWDLSVDPVNIQSVAGPSALGWKQGNEYRAVNHFNYDFDVPLPTPPAGATQPLVQVIVQPGNSTLVREQITYTNPINGLPTVAHIHLPYLGADNGIFAKTLKFHWNVFDRPGKHFVVTVNDVRMTEGVSSSIDFDIFSGPGPMYLWTDICGQWKSLTDANPGILATSFVDTTPVPSVATFTESAANNTHQVVVDGYLDYTDSLRVFTSGYAQRDYDRLFGTDVGKPAYPAGVDIAKSTYFSSGENQSVGGSLLDVPVANDHNWATLLGHHYTLSDRSPQNEGDLVTSPIGEAIPNPVYGVDYTVSYVPRPRQLGVSGLPCAIGDTTVGATSTRTVHVLNIGETPLVITGITCSGSPFSVASSTATPFTLAPGQSSAVSVSFTPTALGTANGTITIQSNDLVNPTATYALSGFGIRFIFFH